MSFLLLGLATNCAGGVAAAYLFLILYAAMLLPFLIVVLNPRDCADGAYVDPNNLYINHLAGLSTHREQAAILALSLFSMASIPPLSGFFAKFGPLLAAASSGQYILIVVGLASSLVAAFYYLRIVKVVFFDEPVHPRPIFFVPEQMGLVTALALTSFMLFFIFWSYMVLHALEVVIELSSATVSL